MRFSRKHRNYYACTLPLMWSCRIEFVRRTLPSPLCLMLTIFNEEAYMTFTSLFNKGLNLFKFDCVWTHARILSWNQSIPSNEGKYACSLKQRRPLMGRMLRKCITIPIRWSPTGAHVSSLIKTQSTVYQVH